MSTVRAARPVRALLEMVQSLASFALEENTFIFTIGVILNVNRTVINVAEIDLFSHRLGNACGERDGDTRLFVAVFVHCADAFHVARMRE